MKKVISFIVLAVISVNVFAQSRSTTIFYEDGAYILSLVDERLDNLEENVVGQVSVKVADNINTAMGFVNLLYGFDSTLFVNRFMTIYDEDSDVLYFITKSSGRIKFTGARDGLTFKGYVTKRELRDIRDSLIGK